MDLAEIGLDGYEMWIDDETQQPEIWSNKTKKCLTMSLSGMGYKQPSFCIEGKTKHVLLHRIVGLMCIPNPDNLPELDHVNGNKLDNRIENLRWASRSTNMRNKPSTKGYYWHKQGQKWKAQIRIDGKSKHLGLYDTKADARQAYVKAIRKYFPNDCPHLGSS
jgi:hypothetical protein